MKLFLWLMILASFCSSDGMADSMQEVALDASHDQIVKRVVVPSVEKPQGEVQLIRRGDQLVVQTLLASRILKRVVAAIDQKEQRRWPESRKGFVDSKRYREELFRATTEIWDRFRQRSDQNEKRQYLAIEFILGPKRNLIVISAPRLTGDYGQLQLIEKSALASWRSSEHYVANNIRDIIEDSFNLDAAEVENLLEKNWPNRR